MIQLPEHIKPGNVVRNAFGSEILIVEIDADRGNTLLHVLHSHAVYQAHLHAFTTAEFPFVRQASRQLLERVDGYRKEWEKKQKKPS